MAARPPRSPEMRPWVRSIWAYSSSRSRDFELVMPNTGGQFLINLFEAELRHWTGRETPGCRTGPLGLQGALIRPVVIDTDQKREICGVAFHPGGLTAFCDWPARNFSDAIVDAADVFGQAANSLRGTLFDTSDPERRLDLIESFLLGRLRHRDDEDRLIRPVVDELVQGMSISAVQARFSLSQCRLHDLFDRRIGLRPKLFTCIERFAAALDAMPDRETWSDLASAHGFAD